MVLSAGLFTAGLVASVTAQAETLGQLPAGRIVTSGTVTTTNPDGSRVTQTLDVAPQDPVSAPVQVPVQRSGSGPQMILPPAYAVAPAAPASADAVPADAAPAEAGFSAPAFPSGREAAPVAATRTLNAVPGREGSGITMASLGGVDTSSIGLMSADNGGLGSDMWRGATRADVGQYLAMLPVATPSPVANDLDRRLLLTSATPPEGQVSGQSLLGIRLDRLIASGRADLAQELGRNAAADTSPAVSIARARAALALADDKTACQELTNLPAGNDPAHDEVDAFATRLSAFCQILSGNHGAANVTLDLAREEAYDNPLFYSLAAEANDGLKLKAPAPKSLDALDLRFYALAKRPLPDNAGAIAVPATVKLIAEDESLDRQIRIEAAERATMSGLYTGEQLALLYRSVPFKPEEVEGAKAGIFPKGAGLRRALLMQAIDAEIMPNERASLMKQFLSTGEAAGIYYASVQAVLPALDGLAPAPELKDFAASATRAFLIAGEREKAAAWFALVQSGGPALGREQRELSALMRLSDPNGLQPISPALAAEIAADLRSGVPATQNFAATEAMIFDASGQILPQNVLEALVAAPRSVGAPEQLLNQLHNAGLKGSKGEVVLLSLVAIGPGGPESADRQAVAQSVSSLRAVHLESEARRLALEALLGRSHAGRG